MKLLLITLILPIFGFARPILTCQFGLYNIAILQTQTELTTDLQIGPYTFAAYQGSPSKQIPNALQQPLETEKYRFQLDEGFNDQNILVVVYQKQTSDNDFPAFAENPQTPMFKKMTGTCNVQE